MTSLAWQLPKRPKVPVELAAACARFQERIGRDATRLEVHPGEVVEAEGLTVVESGRVRPGCWMIGAE